jgi:hypothetical protein
MDCPLLSTDPVQQAVDKEVVLGNGTRHAWANFSNIKQILD